MLRIHLYQKLLYTLATVLFLLFLLPSNAQTFTKTWALAGGGEWNVPGNWDPVGVPEPNDDVLIMGSATGTLNVLITGINVSVNSVTLESADTGQGLSLVVRNNGTLTANTITLTDTEEFTCGGGLTQIAFAGTGPNILTVNENFVINSNCGIINPRILLSTAVGNRLNFNGNLTTIGPKLNIITTSINPVIAFGGSTDRTIDFETDFGVFEARSLVINNTANTTFLNFDPTFEFNSLAVASGSTLNFSNGSIRLRTRIIAQGALNNLNTLTFQGTVNATIDGNFSVNNLIINKGGNFITSQSGVQTILNELNVTSGIFNTGGNILLRSTAANTARIAAVGGTINGNVTQQRFINLPVNQWFEVASPLGGTLQNWQANGVIFTGFSGSNFPGSSFVSAWRYNNVNVTDPTQLLQGWTPFTDINQNTNRGVGIKIFTSAGNYTLSNTGQPLSGSATIPINHRADLDLSWSFIGNPMCSPIDWDQIIKTNVRDEYFVERFIGGNYVYAAYNPIVGAGLNGATANIATGQGFWVRSTGTTPSLTVPQSAKVSSAPFLRDNNENENSFIRLKISNNNTPAAIDETILAFMDLEGVSAAEDDFDAAKFFSTSATLPQLGIGVGSLTTAFNFVPKTATTGFILPLHLSIKVNGNYTITSAEFNAMETFNSCLSFYDIETGIAEPLDENFAKQLALTEGEYGSRFYIIVGTPAFLLAGNETCFNQNDGYLLVEPILPGIILQLLNEAGEFISEITESTTLTNLAAGTYQIVTVIDGETSCLSQPVFITIEEGEEVIASFEASTLNLILNDNDNVVVFTNASLNHESSTWTVTGENVNETFNSTDLAFEFTSAGDYLIGLEVINNTGDCIDTFEEILVVSDPITTSINNISLPAGVKLLTKGKNNYVLAFSEDFLAKNSNIKMYNSLGQLVWSRNNLGGGEQNVKIPHQNSSGMYLLEIINSNEPTRIKIVF
ncbi:MAG: T9SS type A sorting domain-containing protein [Luteibaculaceae bacterium]